ncbi:hypothetical protein [Paenisporosarcina sp. TG-14]|uniref:hypothetical protein n=1 Tax=Paenisporosarcina sp. TG-14 TaxID=1231057 RepID=UPI00036C467A|nr:hypothetical protein [Paenisporosarcina sp. TG-14]
MNIIGNLQETINTFRIVLEGDLGKSNCLSFVTTNGIYFGKQILVNNDLKEVNNTDELTPFIYSKANFFTEEEFNNEENTFLKELDLNETILLEDVKFKCRKAIIQIKHVVLNVNQIVSVQLVSNQAVDEFLENY